MVRAGVVQHPKEWPMSGYNEIMGELRKRYSLIDMRTLMDMLGAHDLFQLRNNYDVWINERLALGQLQREKKWTEAVAVGNKAFVETFQCMTGKRLHHKIRDCGDGCFVLASPGNS